MGKRRTNMGNIIIKNGALFILAASYILVNTTDITAEQMLTAGLTKYYISIMTGR